MKTTVTAAFAALLTISSCEVAHAQDSYISCLLPGESQPSILSIRDNKHVYMWDEEKLEVVPLCLDGERVITDDTYTICAVFDHKLFADVYDLENKKIMKTVINRMNGQVLQYDAKGAVSGRGKCTATTSPYVERRKF